MDCLSVLKVLIQNGSELKSGFFVIGYFSTALHVFGLFFMFCLGFKFLQFSWSIKGFVQFLWEFRGKSGDSQNGFRSKENLDEVLESEVAPFQHSSVAHLERSKSLGKNGSLVCNKEIEDSDGDCVDEEYESESCFEDEKVDVVALRKMVKVLRRRANAAYAELEKERMAAASAADEAMAMILRLQSEKSCLEIESNQYRKIAEQRREYDQEVIQALQWIIMKHESERSVLEEKLRRCRL